MPPKKNIDKTTTADKKTPEKKAPRKRVKRIKPPSKTPAVVKLKIPLKEPISKKNLKGVLSRCIKQEEDITPKQKRMLTAEKKEVRMTNAASKKNEKSISSTYIKQLEGRETRLLSAERKLGLALEASKKNEKSISLRCIKQVEDIKPKEAQLLSAERKVELTNEASKKNEKSISLRCIKQVEGKKPKRKRLLSAKRKVESANEASKKYDESIASRCIKQVEDISPKQARLLSAERKLELANGVARAQLVKDADSPAVPTLTPNSTPSTEPAKEIKKRGRKKKATVIVEPVETPTATIVTDSEEAFDMTPKKRKYVRKQPADPQNKIQNEPTIKRNNVADAKSPTLVIKKKMKQSKITDLKSGITLTPKTTRNNTKKTAQKITPMSEPIKRPRLVIPRKGKRASEITPSDVKNSPFILKPFESPKKEQTVLTRSPKTDPNVEACAIESRKTSTTGMSECFSWTKDISSSSTTTCITVCSNEFVRIDKKLPILKLTNIDYELKKALDKKKNVLSSSDTESDTIEHSPRTPDRENTSDVESQSLGLSTSSITTDSPKSETSVTNNEISDISMALNRLSSKLKNFDLEIINWIGYDNCEVNENVKNLQDKIFRVLKEESEVIVHCRNIKRVLSDDVVDDVANNSKTQEDEQVTAENEFVIPVNACHNSITEDLDKVNQQPSSLNKPVKEKSSENSENNLTSDKVKYTSFDQSCDDDDALSLFAESITGIESSKINSSVASMCNMDAIDYEEYVPQPIKPIREPHKVAYIPSKIADTQNNEVKSKTVCEKQNADSTSIYREPEPDKSFESVNFETSKHTEENTDVVLDSRQNKNIVTEKKKRPLFMSSLYKPLYGIRSIVFRGICFYNLISSCKNIRCRYPHIIPNNNEVRMKLVRLSEEIFIQEYMLIRNWPELRRQYGMFFVEECKRRELTVILVEMAIDFIMKMNKHYREDKILKVEVLESVLLYLNVVDLETCEDLLLYNIQGSLLCDIFIIAIANTQNFSRFKPIFINLTNFMVRHGRTFRIDVATQILERLCILPFEQALSEALLLIVKHTNTTIFDNNMMEHFEKQLSISSADLHAQLLQLKKEASLSRPVVQSICESPRASEIEIVRNPNVMHTEREKRYTSPDTTNVDTLKAAEEPIITRTIDFKRASFGNIQRSFSNSNSSTSNDSEDFRAQAIGLLMSKASPTFRNWRGAMNNTRRILPSVPRPPMRPPMKRRTHQYNYGPYPKYPRRPGPDFF